MQVQPYLNFGGRCEEALSFYRTALGAEVEMLMRFRESPDEPPPGAIPPGWDDKVLADYLRTSRSVNCTPEQIIITTGTFTACSWVWCSTLSALGVSR